MTDRLYACPAPAKLNLFLHVVGRRADGYHLLQTAFEMIDLQDSLDFIVRQDGRIQRTAGMATVATEDDLVVKAARLLQRETGIQLGVDIAVHKKIPAGGGLGGGSSDAATTLLALNHLWKLNLSRAQLLVLAAQLGADVPFFIFGRAAFAEGIGEKLVSLPANLAHNGPYVVLHPRIIVPTAEIFSEKALTRDTEKVKITNLDFSQCKNDLQSVVCEKYAEVRKSLQWLSGFSAAKLTGSGSCIFAKLSHNGTAKQIAEACPSQWDCWAVKSVDCHPLYSMAV